jgi:N-methyl-L-tryptophan oxidase
LNIKDSEDKSFIIDKHPLHKNVILASGFSGTGFKFGLGIGEIVSDLVDNRKPKHDISAFSASRKIDLSKSKL